MIIARAPLRITLGGGPADVSGGFTIAAAIDRYVYVTLHETFVQDLIVKYSRIERVPSANYVEHPIVREALCSMAVTGSGLEIASMADVQAGTGLGSSSAFTVALLRALYTYRGETVSAEALARDACDIEIMRLEAPIGRQDQYIAAYGGMRVLTFGKDVLVDSVVMDADTLATLEENLLLFFTGQSRAANEILSGSTEPGEAQGIARATRVALNTGELWWFARLLTEQWQAKKRRTPQATNDAIDMWFDLALANGAMGGKLVGAGGGGFLLFYAEDKQRLRSTMRAAGLRELRFRFDFDGAKVL